MLATLPTLGLKTAAELGGGRAGLLFQRAGWPALLHGNISWFGGWFQGRGPHGTQCLVCGGCTLPQLLPRERLNAASLFVRQQGSQHRLKCQQSQPWRHAPSDLVGLLCYPESLCRAVPGKRARWGAAHCVLTLPLGRPAVRAAQRMGSRRRRGQGMPLSDGARADPIWAQSEPWRGCAASPARMTKTPVSPLAPAWHCALFLLRSLEFDRVLHIGAACAVPGPGQMQPADLVCAPRFKAHMGAGGGGWQ